MSIIQEALKKAQDTQEAPPPLSQPQPAVTETAPFRAEPPAPSKAVFKPVMIAAFAAALIITAGFGAHFFSSIKKSFPAKTNPPDTAIQQQVTYKPAATPVPEPKGPLAPIQKMADLKSAVPPKLILNGIMYIETGPRAIINGNTVEVGDSVSGAEVRRINRDNVVLTFNDAEITIDLK